MQKPGEHFGENDKFKPIELFPEGNEAINKTLPIWNFAQENFYKEVEVYNFIVAALSKGCNEEIIRYWYNYFGEKVILSAFEKYKDNVSLGFRNHIKELIDDLLNNNK